MRRMGLMGLMVLMVMGAGVCSARDFVWMGQAQVEPGESVVMDGLVRWWKFDESSGSVSTDLVGGNTLTNSSVVITNGQFGNALYFNGSATSVGNNINEINSTNLSISVWVHVPTVASSRWIVNQWVTTPAVRGVAFFVTSSSGGTWHWQVGSSSLNANFVAPSLTNQWVHWVLTATKDTPSTLQIYTNSVLAKAVTNYTRSDSDGSDILEIGGANEGGVNRLIGSIDNLRVYNRILTTNEIQQLYLNP